MPNTPSTDCGWPGTASDFSFPAILPRGAMGDNNIGGRRRSPKRCTTASDQQASLPIMRPVAVPTAARNRPTASSGNHGLCRGGEAIAHRRAGRTRCVSHQACGSLAGSSTVC